ncbi:OmpA family protein [Xylophilus sp.]|uniref:OmpA family protein n=1 Tax=Xylophilus sp. TaxID=2653893 RepID=UPI0013BC48E8|nr:OmpA family protein [Xylophilus sp.]KAF1044200.1 MAG: hypothetical protein GAK38_03629 [Xylophilus sp.]
MSQSSDGDGQQRFVLGFVFGLVALVVATVVGTVVYQRGVARQPGTPVAAAVVAPAAGDVLLVIPADRPTVRAEAGVVRFYVATGRADVAPDAAAALAAVAQGVAAGRTAVVSGYHDSTGDPAANEELAKQRALAVREALKSIGVPEEKIELRKPEALTGTGSEAEARRVEVVLAN